MLTVEKCLTEIRRALSGEDLSPEDDAIGLINRAGEQLVSLHDWNWCQRKATLSLTNNQAYVDLPYSIRSLIGVQSPMGVDGAGAGAGVALTTVQELVDRRNDSLSSSPPASKYLGAVIGAPDESSGGDGRVIWRLELWPTPSVDSGGEDLDIFYRQGWVDVDNAATTKLELPRWCEQLFLEILKAYAKGTEAQEVASLDARLLEIVGGITFKSAVMRDSVAQPSYGPVRNAAVSIGQGVAELRAGTVLPPS